MPRRRVSALKTICLWCAFGTIPGAHAAPTDVILNEIFYNSPDALGSDEDLEWIELANRGAADVDVSGWLVKDSNDAPYFTVPASTSIAPGAFLVLARNLPRFRSVWGLTPQAVGDLPFLLGNDGGDHVRLFTAAGAPVDDVEYDDGAPWPKEADGNGSSLERVDATLDRDDFSGFLPSLPASPPGTPGAPNSRRGTVAAKFDVVINEIAYHPVVDPSGDPHLHCTGDEFIELHNRGAQAIDVSGWRFADGVSFTFPAGLVIPAGGYFAVYKDLARFTARHGAVANKVGPFDLELDDGGERILLVDAAGQPVDSVRYDDADPWPVSPDGLTGSLELVDPASDNGRGRNWRASTPFQGTPGAQNSANAQFIARGRNSPPEITKAARAPASNPFADAITSQDDVLVTARVTDPQGIGAVTLLYQVLLAGSYIRKTDPEFKTDWHALAMTYDAAMTHYRALIPRVPHRTLVRWRIEASDAAPSPLVSSSPHADDPVPNYAYFVYDGLPDYVASQRSDFGPAGFVHSGLGKLPVIQMIADAGDTYCAQYPDASCGPLGYPTSPNPDDNTYYWLCTVAFENEVYDHVEYRLRGGVHRYHWPKRSWKLRFPKGKRFDGRGNDGLPFVRRRSVLNLIAEQHNDGRPRGESGVFESLAWKLFRESDVVAGETSFVQLRIVDEADELGQYTGDFHGIYCEAQQIDADLLDQIGRPSDEASSLYKVDGSFQKELPDCTLDASDVLAFQSGYTSINTADWYRREFDVERYLSFRAVVEMSHHYDMGSKNYYYYSNSATGLWEMTPWDLDNTFGADSGDGSEPFRDRVLPKFPLEYRNRFRFLWQTIYDLDRLHATIEEWRELIREVADADRDRWNQGPDCNGRPGLRGNQCGFYGFFDDRMDALLKLAPATSTYSGWIATRRSAVRSIFSDAAVPATPANVAPAAGTTAAQPVTLQSSAFSDPGGDAHAAIHWIVVQEALPEWTRPIWESESGTALTQATVPTGFLEEGVRYLWRVRHEDATGRWSFLSEPTAFVAGRAAPGERAFQRGNVNGDGEADISDAVSILLFLFAGGSSPCRDAADVNDSGVIDLADPVALLGFLFRAGPPPAAPGLACGVDPTPDSLPPCTVSSCP